MSGDHDRDVTGPQSLPKKLWKWSCFSYLSQFGPIIHLIVKPNMNRPEIVIIFIHTTSWILLILPKEWPWVWLKGLPQILCKCFITSSICPILPVHNVKNCEFWNTCGLKGFERTVDMYAASQKRSDFTQNMKISRSKFYFLIFLAQFLYNFFYIAFFFFFKGITLTQRFLLYLEVDKSYLWQDFNYNSVEILFSLTSGSSLCKFQFWSACLC